MRRLPDVTHATDAHTILDARSDAGPGTLVTIGNVKPRTDVNGAMIDAHEDA